MTKNIKKQTTQSAKINSASNVVFKQINKQKTKKLKPLW